MSLFATPEERLKQALNWFNSLKNEEQLTLLANLGEPATNLTPEQADNLTTMTLEIIQASSMYNKEQIVAKLIQLGIKDVYARLFVDTVTTKPTLPQLDAKRLLSLDDEHFRKAIEAILTKFYVENNTTEQLSQYAGLDEEDLIPAMRFIRDNILFVYVRGELSPENLRRLLTERVKFPEARIDVLLEVLERNRQTIMSNFLFKNTQDTYLSMQRMERIQLETISLLRELVSYIKNKFGEGQQPQSQPSLYR